MKIKTLPIAQLKPAPYNPRRELKAGDPEFERIRRSIKTFGLVEPLIWNERSGYLVGGHQRLAVLKAEGVKQIEVTVVNLTDSRERALNAALNKISGVWDNEKLREVMAALDEADITLTGFDDGELAKLVNYKGAEGKTKPDDTPEFEKVAIAKTGEMWILGDHRLLCGDSTKPETYTRLMAGETAAMVATDPPYMVDYTGERPGDKGGRWKDTKWDSNAAPQAFFDAWIAAAAAVAKPNAAWYCWHASVNGHLPANAWKKLGILLHQQIIWVKPSAMFGYSFFPWAHEPAWLGWKHEPAWFGWKKGNKPPRDGDYTHALTTVWTLDYDGKARMVNNEHPTQKPVEIFAVPMRKHTQRGEICLEPFSGSGSQIIAGERLGRRVFAIEQSPQFVDVAVRRWEKFTGKKATRETAAPAKRATAGVHK
jgi:DNA modification methylase